MLLYIYIAIKANFYQSTLIQINYYIQFGAPKMVFFSGGESSV